eukprot:4433049-Prymnesium_polylepis.3
MTRPSQSADTSHAALHSNSVGSSAPAPFGLTGPSASISCAPCFSQQLKPSCLLQRASTGVGGGGVRRFDLPGSASSDGSDSADNGLAFGPADASDGGAGDGCAYAPGAQSA